MTSFRILFFFISLIFIIFQYFYQITKRRYFTLIQGSHKPPSLDLIFFLNFDQRRFWCHQFSARYLFWWRNNYYCLNSKSDRFDTVKLAANLKKMTNIFCNLEQEISFNFNEYKMIFFSVNLLPESFLPSIRMSDANLQGSHSIRLLVFTFSANILVHCVGLDIFFNSNLTSSFVSLHFFNQLNIAAWYN